MTKQAKALSRKATTALDVRLLQQIPMAVNTAARKNKPIYDPAIPPLSMPPVDKPGNRKNINNRRQNGNDHDDK